MASGNTLLVFTPQSSQPPASNPAGKDTRGSNNHLILTFDDTTSQSALWTAVMPRNYAGGGITAYVHYSAVATTNTVDFDGSFERIGDQQQDVDADGFAAVQSVDNTTVPGTSGNVDIVNITFTDGAQMDSVAVGESFRFKLARDIADDAVGNIEVHKVELKET